MLLAKLLGGVGPAMAERSNGAGNSRERDERGDEQGDSVESLGIADSFTGVPFGSSAASGAAFCGKCTLMLSLFLLVGPSCDITHDRQLRADVSAVPDTPLPWTALGQKVGVKPGTKVDALEFEKS